MKISELPGLQAHKRFWNAPRIWKCKCISMFLLRNTLYKQLIYDLAMVDNHFFRADSRLAPNQWETLLHCLSLARRKPRISPVLVILWVWFPEINTIYPGPVLAQPGVTLPFWRSIRIGQCIDWLMAACGGTVYHYCTLAGLQTSLIDVVTD